MGKLAGKVIEASKRASPCSDGEVGRALRNLREISDLTLDEMARRLRVPTSEVARIESGQDQHLSTIQGYVEALGASLKIAASFSADAPLALRVRDAFDLECMDDDQFLLPLIDDGPFRPHRDVVLSIRPQYSEKILEGRKKVELRRRFPVSAPKGTIAYIYSTSPVRAMVGVAEIADVLKLPVVEIWRRFEEQAFIEREAFEKYFEGVEEGFVLRLEDARAFKRGLPLALLRERFSFEPPQSFLYANHELRKALEHECSVVSH